MTTQTVIRASMFILSLLSACKQEKGMVPTLEPPDRRAVYHTRVGDAAEAELLHQQLGIEIKNLVMNDLFFYAGSDSIVRNVSALGYSVDTSDLRRVYSQVVRVEGGDEKVLSRFGVQVINRDKGSLVVRGTLEGLSNLRNSGSRLVALDAEVRPREIVITVRDQSDVQHIYELGVDIFTAVKDSTGRFVVNGSAFDFQIDSLRSLNYGVSIKKDSI